MNIIYKLTLRYMRLNKRRTIVTMIGIAIAVAMITSVSTISSTAMDYMGRRAEENGYRFHVKFDNYCYSDNDIIVDELQVENYVLAKDVGNSAIDTYNLRVFAVNDSYYEMMNVELVAGSYPKSVDEILLSGKYANAKDKFDFNVGESIEIGEKIYVISGIVSEKSDDYEANHLYETQLCQTYAVYTYLDESTLMDDDKINGYFYIDNVDDSLMDRADATVAKLGSDATVEYNYQVMSYYGFTPFSEVNVVVKVIKHMLMAIIIVGGICFVANGFFISISERNRYLGMLASVGATKKQKRSSVYFEAFIEGIISIPFGFLLGVGGMSVASKLIQPVVNNVTGSNLCINIIVNWEVAMWTLACSVLTIFLSAYIPARRASKITAIESIGQNREIQVTPYELKTGKITKKIFGFEGNLALKNLKRNKRRYEVIIISMFISITLFISIYSITYFIKAEMISQFEQDDYNVRLSYYNYDAKEDEKGQLLEHEDFITLSDRLIKSSYTTNAQRYLENEDVFAKIDENITDVYDEQYLSCVNKLGMSNNDNIINLITMNNEDLKTYLVSVDVNYDEFVSDKYNAIIFDGVKVADTSEGMERYVYNGDMYKSTLENMDVIIESWSANSYSYDENGQLIDSGNHMELDVLLKVLSKEDKLMGMGNVPYILITPELAKDILCRVGSGFSWNAFFETEEDKELVKFYENEIKRIEIDEADGYMIYNLTEQREQMQSFIFLIEIFAYGFIVLISLICLANIINTLTTSMNLRRREFAMFKSVGMTERAFKRMLLYESTFYGMKSLMLGLPTGMVIMLVAKYFFELNMGMKFSIPWNAYIIAIVGVFVVIVVTILCSRGRVRNEKIIDGLRNENY